MSSDERDAIVSADSVPSSPASTRFELASPSTHIAHHGSSSQQAQPYSRVSALAPRGEDSQDAERLSGQQQDGPAADNPQSSTDPSNSHVSVPTAPGQVARLGITSAFSHNPDSSSATQKGDSERTADIKRHSAAANTKQTAIDEQHDVHTADTQIATTKKTGRGGKVTDEIDPAYALDAIPSLDDYIRYIQLLQDNWKDAPVIDIVYNKLSYVVHISPEETRVPSISRSFADFFRWISFRLPKPVPLHVFKSHTQHSHNPPAAHNTPL